MCLTFSLIGTDVSAEKLFEVSLVKLPEVFETHFDLTTARDRTFRTVVIRC